MKFNSILLIILFSLGCNQSTNEDQIANDKRETRIDTVSKSKPDAPRESYEKKYFSNVRVFLFIDYTDRISAGQYIYKSYEITPGQSEFNIEARNRRNEPSYWAIPYEKESVILEDSSSVSQDSLKLNLSLIKSSNYFSEKKIIHVEDTDYVVYRHVNYNCYDPFCGGKHGHSTIQTGITYFSPAYGILVSIDNDQLEHEILAYIEGVNIPTQLILEILKKENAKEGIVELYKKRMKSGLQ